MLLLLLLFFVNRCFIHSFSTDYPQHNSNAQQDTVVFRVPSWWLAKQLCIYSYSLPTVHIMIVYFFQKGPIKPSCVSALLASLHAVYIWCLLFHSPLFCSLQASSYLSAFVQGQEFVFFCHLFLSSGLGGTCLNWAARLRLKKHNNSLRGSALAAKTAQLSSFSSCQTEKDLKIDILSLGNHHHRSIAQF